VATWKLCAPTASPQQAPSHLQEGDVTQESPHGATSVVLWVGELTVGGPS
jgi:hypothetical protein